MICPHCEKPVRGVIARQCNAIPGKFPRTINCVAYCCENCACVLGVESNPHIRDSEIKKLQQENASLAKAVRELMARYAHSKLSRE